MGKFFTVSPTANVWSNPPLMAQTSPAMIYIQVTFAKEIDPTLQLLRQLTYDYRNRNPMFRAFMESKIASTAILQVR
jgi:hypothetical protein